MTRLVSFEKKHFMAISKPLQWNWNWILNWNWKYYISLTARSRAIKHGMVVTYGGDPTHQVTRTFDYVVTGVTWHEKPYICTSTLAMTTKFGKVVT